MIKQVNGLFTLNIYILQVHYEEN